VDGAAGRAEVTSYVAERAQEQQARVAGLRDEIAAVSQRAAENGGGATRVAEAAREQAEIERVAAEVSGRLNTCIVRFSAMT